MNNELLEKRRKEFEKILLHITADQHQRYLKDNCIDIKFNPFKEKTWHHEFDLKCVNEIEIFKLYEEYDKYTKVISKF